MPLARMLRETSAREIREYEAFAKIEPFGDEWRQAAMICAAIYNAQRVEGRPITEEDVFPALAVPEEFRDDDEYEQTDEEVAHAFAAAGCQVIHARK